MSTTVTVPALGNDTETVIVTRWLKAVGDQVQAGQPLVEVETSKSSFEIETPADGLLLQRFAEEGAEVAVHSELAIIGAETERDILPTEAVAIDEPPAPAMLTADVTPAPVSPLVREEPDGSGRNAILPPRTSAQASPRARVLAARNGIDLSSVVGSGPGGMVSVNDVRYAKKRRSDAGVTLSADAPQLTATSSGPGGVVRAPLSRTRRVIAERMAASLAGSAQLTLNRSAGAEALQTWHSRLRSAEFESLPRITINDLVMFLAGRTLKAFSGFNAHFSWEGVTSFEAVDLGFAVDTPGGLLVPVIRSCNTLTLAQVATTSADLAAAALDGTLRPDQYSGATFTVSNLGAWGVEYFTPILNLPEVAILGVGAIQGHGPDVRLPYSLTFDHRANDGVAAARLLDALCRATENVDVLSAA